VNRPARSLTEIECLPPIAAPALEGYLLQHGPALTAETLVYLFRELESAGRTELCQIVAALLHGLAVGTVPSRPGHVEHIVMSVGRGFGLTGDPERRKDFRGACYQQMWQAITAGRTEEPFWEERFYRALKFVAISAGRALRRALDKPWNACPEEGPQVDEVTAVDADDQEDLVIGDLACGTIEAAIRSLPDLERTAAWLHWVKDWKVESDDPAEPTVAKAMGISGGMVRRYLRRAKDALRRDPAISAIRKE
jgi:DNA-directed RNA polymerase specialized sigma24 family protein